MKIKTSELQGAALDYAVAICEGRTVRRDPMGFGRQAPGGYWIWEEAPSGQGGIDLSKSVYMQLGKDYSPSTNWAQGGPIVDREFIQTQWLVGAHQWTADKYKPGFIHFDGYGPTLLIAAMRCYVASKLGAEVEIPDELLTA